MLVKLKFANPVGIKSENFTGVFLGDQIAKDTAPVAGNTITAVELCDTASGVLGLAVVRGCWVGPASAMPALLLESAHDPVSRGWSGAMQTLANRNPVETVGYDTTVTILQLSYTGSAIKTPDLIIP